MKIREYTFRQLENRLFYISGQGITGFDELRNRLPGGELAEGVLVCGYVDHLKGLMFQVLCGVQKSGTVLLFLDANTAADMTLTYEDVAGCECEPMAKEEVDFSRYMHLTQHIEMQVKLAGRAGALAKLVRLNKKLDPARTEAHPDVVRMRYESAGGDRETCPVRCERMNGEIVTGTVLGEPAEAAGFRQGDSVEFSVEETGDGSVECVFLKTAEN